MMLLGVSWRAGHVARLPVVAVPHFYKSLIVDSCWIAFDSVLSDWRKVLESSIDLLYILYNIYLPLGTYS
jgi:hypothetical protein